MAKDILKGIGGGIFGLGGSKKSADGGSASPSVAVSPGPIIKSLTADPQSRKKRVPVVRDGMTGASTILRDTLGGN